MSTPRRSPEQIIEQLEKLTTTPNLAADVGPIARQEFVTGVNRIASEVFQLHTIAQQNRALLRVDIALTQLRSTATALTDDRVKALEALRRGLSSTLANVNTQTTNVLQDTVEGFRGSAETIADPNAPAGARMGAGLILAGGVTAVAAGVAGAILAVKRLFKKAPDPNAPAPPPEKKWKRVMKALLLPASIVGVFALGLAGRKPREQDGAPARELIGPTVNSGSVAGLQFERRTVEGGTAPETVIMHNGVPYRFALRWPPAATTGGTAAPAAREDNWSAQLSTIVDRGARVNGGVGINFSGGFGPFGGQGETRIELGGLQQIAAGMPSSTDPVPTTPITRTVFLRFPLGSMGADQRLFVQEQIRAGAPVVVEGNEVRVQATIVLRPAGAAVGPTAAPEGYTAINDTVPLDVTAGERTVNLGTTDATAIDLSVPNQSLVSQNLAGTGTVTVVSGPITLVREGPMLTIRQSAAATTPGTAIVSIRRARDPSPRSVRVQFGPAFVEAPIKSDTVVIDPTARQHVFAGGFPATGTLTINGAPVLQDASRTSVPPFRITRSGASLTVLPANPNARITPTPLVITGGGMNRTISVSYEPEVAPAFVLPNPLALNAATPQRTFTGLPTTELTIGGTRIAATATAPVDIDNVRVTRSNGGRMLRIEPLTLRTRVNQSLTITGGGVNATTLVTFTPAPETAPAVFALPPTIRLTPTSMQQTIPDVPAVALTARGGLTPPGGIAIAVADGSTDVGDVRITRSNSGRTIVIEPRTPRTIVNQSLRLTGTGVETTAQVIFTPAPETAPVVFELPTPIVLLPDTPQRTFADLPTTDLVIGGTTVRPTPDRTFVISNIRVTRSNGGRTLLIEPLTPRTTVNQSLTITGGGVNTTAQVTFTPTPETAPAFTLPTTIALTPAVPQQTFTTVPNIDLTIGGTLVRADATAPVDIDTVRVTRSNGGRTLVIEPRTLRTAVNKSLTITGGGGLNITTQVTFTPTPETAPAFTLPTTIALTPAVPQQTFTTVPNIDLTIGGTLVRADATAPVDIDTVRVTRSNGGRTLVIEPRTLRTAVNKSLTITGGGGLNITTQVTFTPTPEVAPVPFVLPASIRISGTPPRHTITNGPDAVLRINNTTNLSRDNTTRPLIIDNIRITRSNNGATIVFEPVDEATSIDQEIVVVGPEIDGKVRINYTPAPR